jgi:Na+-translocating ferredoxin:NAD+ oxidoreductase RnfE subunit
VFLISLKKDVRKSIGRLLKALFSKHIFRAFIFLTIYVLLNLYLLNLIGLWDKSLTKDSTFWFCTLALVTFFKINNARDFKFFNEILLDSVKWIVVIEFLINFYTFGLWTELILVPIMVFISVIQAYAETDKKYESVQRLFQNIISIIGFVLLVYIIYRTVTEYQKTFTIQNLKSLLHPIIMTFLFLPFAYLLALYMIYEVLFVRVDFLTRDTKVGRQLKLQIILVANLNIERLNRVSKNLNVRDFTPDDIKGFVSQVAR